MFRAYAILVLLIILLSPAFADEGQDPARILIEFKNGRVTMDLQDAPIRDVLHELARKADMEIRIDPGLEGRITFKAVDAPLEEVLNGVCRSRSLVYEYLHAQKRYRIISMGAYATTAGERVSAPAAQPGDPAVSLPQISHPKSSVGRSNKPESIKTQVDRRGRALYKKGEILIRIRDGVPESQIQALHASIGNTVIGRIRSARLQKIKLAQTLSEEDAIRIYADSGLVEFAEPHALRYPSEVTPNDPYFASQWGLKRIKAPQAWESTQGGPGVVVAVIDTGVDYSHSDLAQNIWMNQIELFGSPDVDDDGNDYVDDIQGWDFAGALSSLPDGDADPMDSDTHGHGTHVAGIIGAVGNNSIGIAGVAWDVKIMPLKVQVDGAVEFEDFHVIEAFYYAMDNGARIINCSFGGSAAQEAERSALTAARDKGILVVCAAGNDSTDLDTAEEDENTYPASYDLDNIVSVAAGQESGDLLASFSNFGLTHVDLAAPGDNVKSTVPAGPYTESFVTVDSSSGATRYAAYELEFAGKTGSGGITVPLYHCGLGMSAQDFPSGVSGFIALIQRGQIYFSEKTRNAMNAGAAGVIIYNNVEGPADLWTLISPENWVPAVGIARADGEALIAAGLPLTVTLVNRTVDSVAFYANKFGTSMAAPHVSGVAALILSKDPALDCHSVKTAIVNSADKVPSLAGKVVSGGRLNGLCALYSAVAASAGDLSLDTRVGIEDAVIALQITTGRLPQICPAALTRGMDVNGDGRIGIEEVIMILRETAGLSPAP